MAAHAYTSCWVHLVWGMKDRAQIHSRKARKRIAGFLQKKAQEKKMPLRACYVNADHVHALIDLPTKLALAGAVRFLKGSSSRWITKNGVAPKGFAWARGYGAFSVSPQSVNRVACYIARQEAHHQQTSFRAEYEFMTERAEQADTTLRGQTSTSPSTPSH